MEAGGEGRREAIFRVDYRPGRREMARRKILPKALDIDFRGGLTDEVTPHAGAALLVAATGCLPRFLTPHAGAAPPVEAGRISGVMGAAEKQLPAKKPLASALPAPSPIRNHGLEGGRRAGIDPADLA